MALAPALGNGDAAYCTRKNITAVEKAGIRAYVALLEQGKRTSLFTIDAFAYDAERDVYTCPRGEILRRQGHDHRGGYVRYAAKASACDACPLKSKCTNRAKGRWVSRSLEEEYLERVRAYRDTQPYRKALRKRAVWVEPLFAEAKGWHGAGRFRLRRLEKVNTEALMTAAGQNVKRLLAFGTRRPKRPSQAAALRRPEASRREFHGTRRHGRRCPRGPARPFQQAGAFCEVRRHGVLRSCLVGVCLDNGSATVRLGKSSRRCEGPVARLKLGSAQARAGQRQDSGGFPRPRAAAAENKLPHA